MLIAMSVIGVIATLVWAIVITHRPSSTDFHELTPVAFEHAIGSWLARDGWIVDHRGRTGDEGIDLLAFRGAELLVVQCKRYESTAAVSPAQVRELYGSARAVAATTAVMVTTGRVSLAAQSWASSLPADGPRLLIRTGSELASMRRHRLGLLP